MKKLPLIILSVILSLVLITAHLFLVCRFRLDNICLAAQTGKGIVLANDSGTDIKLFLMNRDRLDHAESCISYKKIFEDSEGELGYNYPLEIAENNEKIYLLNVKHFFSERDSEYELRLLDFKRKKSDIIFSFTEKEISDKINYFLGSEENAGASLKNGYFFCGNTFDIDSDGIALYFAEQPPKYRGTNSVYRCRLIGGELVSAEKLSEYRTDQIDDILILGNNAVQLDNGYHLLIGGKNIDENRYSMLCLNENSVIARGLEDGEFYRINIDGGFVTKFPENRELNLERRDISDFYTVKTDSSEKIIAVGFDGEKSFLYDVDSSRKFELIHTESAVKVILHSVLILAASSAAVWLVGALIYVLRARGRISVKFAALIIPVMIFCDFIAYSLIGFGMNAIEDHIFKNNLKAVSVQYGSLNLTDGIGGFDGEYQSEVNRFIQILVDSEYLKSVYWTEDRGVSADVNFLGYIKGRNSFASAADIIEGNYDVDMISLLPSKTAEKILQAVESKSDKYCRIYDGGLDREFLISPTEFSGDNSVNGVFLFSVSSAEVRYNTDKLLKRLMNYKLILSLVISLLFTLSAVFPLRGLKKLQKKSADYLSGVYIPKLSVQKKHGGCINEIDVISDKFDGLLNTVYNDFNEIDNLRKANAAYFSDVILKIFNKKTINSVKFGESASVNAYCIKAFLPAEKYSGFDQMNKLLNALAKSLKEHNAFAADIDNTSISVYSLEPESLNILFFLRGYDSEITAAADRCYIDISIVNIGGSLRFNIVREDEKRGEILMNTLKNTGSAAAVTQTALSGRSGGLSVICIGMVDNEFIYEISDGISFGFGERFANSIRDPLRLGIEKYFNGDRTAAREMFVTILKTQQNNSVARYYINLLDGEINDFEENLQ